MAVILGLDKLVNKLDKLSDIDIEDTLNKACILVENDAKINCPVDSGQLRASITHEVRDKTGIVGTNVEYAPYVEYGTGIYAKDGNGRQDRWSYQDAEGAWHSTVGQQPQPFLEPALLTNEDEIINLFEDKIKQEVEDV